MTLVPAQKMWSTQFCITNGSPVRSGWADQVRVGDANVYLYADAEHVAIRTSDGQQTGVFIGTVIDVARERVIDHDLTLDLPASAGECDEAIEQFAYKLGGSWLLVLTVRDHVRIYLDCNGSKSLVYDPTMGVAAATAGLILDDNEYDERFDSELYDTLRVAHKGWFPGGLTAHVGLKRLMANHYLNLDDWTAKRHWPNADFTWSVTTREAAGVVADNVRRWTTALRAEGTVVSALTGGNESRFLMAANREMCADIDYATVAAPAAKRDVVLASRLAEIAGAQHVVLPLVEATLDEQTAWRYRASHAVCEDNVRTHPSIRPLAKYGSFIGGMGGETGRAFFWRSTDDEHTPLSGEKVARRLGMPPSEQVNAAIQTWIEGLSHLNSLSILDIAYIELRVASWGFGPAYATLTVPHMQPLIFRESYEAMLRLPPDAKRTSALYTDGIAEMWPEIGAVPLNRYGDYRDVLLTMRKATNPESVARKLRKLFG